MLGTLLKKRPQGLLAHRTEEVVHPLRWFHCSSRTERTGRFASKSKPSPYKVKISGEKQPVAEIKYSWATKNARRLFSRRNLVENAAADSVLAADKDLERRLNVALNTLKEQSVFNAERNEQIFNGLKYEKVDIERAFKNFRTELLNQLGRIAPSEMNEISVESYIYPDMSNAGVLYYNAAMNRTPEQICDMFTLTSAADQELFVLERLFTGYAASWFVKLQEMSTNSLNLRNPPEWYPEARKIPRTIYMHVGPTNSGKTYNALKRLKEAQSGFYAGPLRLLAREIYDRFQSENIPCNLVTGEEVIDDLNEFGSRASISSGTIEMIDLNTPMDVAVIDEIQMIDNTERGWAWTAALLGVQAREVHLCGEESAVTLVQQIAKKLGEEVIVRVYKRLGALEREATSIERDVKNLREGDCVIAFSKRNIFALKRLIEEELKLPCSVIYGSLPPESRALQAHKFNTGITKILVASDAVGMGLNLNIKRIVFSTHEKFDGFSKVPVSIPQTKQIAGRAGRYSVSPTGSAKGKATRGSAKTGYVTAFSQNILDYVARCLDHPTEPLKEAALLPPDKILSQHALNIQDNNNVLRILSSIRRNARTSFLFSLIDMRGQITTAKAVSSVDDILLIEQLRMITAPVMVGQEDMISFFHRLCEAIAQCKTVSFFDLKHPGVPLLRRRRPHDKEILLKFEALHKCICLYLWLTYRFPTTFVDRENAVELKNLTEKCINDAIEDNGLATFRPQNEKRTNNQSKSESSKRPKRTTWYKNKDENSNRLRPVNPMPFY